MMDIKKIICVASVLLFTGLQVNAERVWTNSLRNDFLRHNAVIYTINIRTFNANDVNGNGIIDFDEGETSGTFLNAIKRLDELKAEGVTALHVLPITPVGKTKALGTAGSLYASAGFNTINPQLQDKNSNLSLEDQAREFVLAAHKKGIAVIVDVPSCGSYDLFLQRPELFVKDASGQPVIPSDWTDVRLLDAGSEEKINQDVLNVYKDFVDLMINIGFDGIRADVAHSKPAKFWKELIDYSRKRDPQFTWLAESSNSWKDAVSPNAVYTPYDKLLQAGFDGYYGSYFNLKNWTKAQDLKNQVELDMSLTQKLGEPKSVIGSFSTHDELSPIMEKGRNFSRMIMWLNATLPLNAYYVDGFPSGDNYIYFWANRKAKKTFTDDDIYFAHRGKIDIFNFSRKPGGGDSVLKEEFVKANQLKDYVNEIYKNGNLKFLNTTDAEAFAYAVNDALNTVIVIGNLNFTTVHNNVQINVPKLKQEMLPVPITFMNPPEIKKGKIITTLDPGEIQVLIFENFSVK